MSDTTKLTFEDSIAFAIQLRLALEKIRSQTSDGNIREYVDYLLKDDRHENSK